MLFAIDLHEDFIDEEGIAVAMMLSRWVFFGNQGEFDTGDYVEIMNKASCLSLVSNAILYWNTVKISDIVDRARQQGETINDDDLAHISPLRFRHVRAHGTYFVDEK